MQSTLAVFCALLLQCVPLFAQGEAGAEADRSRRKLPVELQLQRRFATTCGSVSAAAFSADGRSLALGGKIGDVRVFSYPEMKLRWQADPSDHWIGTLRWSPDGKILACMGRHLTLHDAATGSVMRRWPDSGPTSFAWQADGKRFAAACGGLYVYSRDGERLWGSRVRNRTGAVAFDEAGSLLVGSRDGCVWRVAEGGKDAQLVYGARSEDPMGSAHIGLVCRAGLAFDVATVGAVRRGKQEFEVPGVTFAFDASRDGSSFAAGGQTDVKRTWPPPSPVCRWWHEGGVRVEDLAVPSLVTALAVHPDGGKLFVACDDGHASIRTAMSAAPDVTVPGARCQSVQLALSHDGTVLAVGKDLWSVEPTHGGPVRALPGARLVCDGGRRSELLVTYSGRTAVIDGPDAVEVASLDSNLHVSAVAGPRDWLLDAGLSVLLDRGGKVRVEFDDYLRGLVCDVARGPSVWAFGTLEGVEGEDGGLLVTDANGSVLHFERSGPIRSLDFSPKSLREAPAMTGVNYLVFVVSGRRPFGKTRIMRRRLKDGAICGSAVANCSCWRYVDRRYALACVDQRLQLWDADGLKVVADSLVAGSCYTFKVSADRRTLVRAKDGFVEVYRVVVNGD
ncbi:MAG: WD40 repeat domain-containing protein [Planctomycetota bacterium]